jgi:hypothetical protein
MKLSKLTPGMALRYCNTQDAYVTQLGLLNEYATEPDNKDKCDSIMKLLDEMKHTQGLIKLWERRIEQKESRIEAQ